MCLPLPGKRSPQKKQKKWIAFSVSCLEEIVIEENVEMFRPKTPKPKTFNANSATPDRSKLALLCNILENVSLAK
jgi:hypothetical protein